MTTPRDDTDPGAPVSRRAVLGGLGGLVAAGVTACTSSSAHDSSSAGHGGHGASTRSFAPPTPAPTTAGQRVVERTLRPRPTQLDLGGPIVSTWAFGDAVPAPVLRASAGDLVRVRLDNELPAETTVHWHGIRLRNPADGVPGLTQSPVSQGGSYTYEFTAPDPGTYWFHPHVGLQLDRALYGPLVVDDPREPGAYDAEWIVVLDDWIDGTGQTPDEVLAKLQATAAAGGGHMDHGGVHPGSTGSTGAPGGIGPGGMGPGGMGMGPAPWGPGGDVAHPYHLINGKIATAPVTFEARPGQRVRIRVVNAASDTIYAVSLGGHRLTVTHTDGWPVQPRETTAFYIGMGERYDVTVTLADGAFPLVAKAYDKQGHALAVVRTASGPTPSADPVLAELSAPAGSGGSGSSVGQILVGSDLAPAPGSTLDPRPADTTLPVLLQGQMAPYSWTINGAAYGQNEPLVVTAGQRASLAVTNMSMMPHPVHVHGHTFALPSGLRKDTVLVRPMQRLALAFDADNPGAWMVHCHNAYHGEAGMMIELRYR